MSSAQPTRTIQPYLFFKGNCEQAVDFYRKALSAEVQIMMRFKDAPPNPSAPPQPPGWENKIMHVSLKIGDAVVMASDGCGDGKVSFQGFSLSLAVPTEAEADRYFNALAEGGQIQMPLAKTFWSPRFGMLVDRFGIGWMINVVAPMP